MSINSYNFSNVNLARVYFNHHSSKIINLNEENSSLVVKVANWKTCSLVSKLWNRVCEENHPLSVAIKNHLKEVVVALLNMGCPSTIKILGTKIAAPRGAYTPYLCAVDYEASEIEPLLLERDKGFSQRFIQMQLIALRFDLKGSYFVDGVKFLGGSLDHMLHHYALIPDLYDSLFRFFQKNEEIKMSALIWDVACAKRLLQSLKGSFPCCTVCPVKKKGHTSDELFIYSDTKEFDNIHWISVVYSKTLIAIGNRGYGCEMSGFTIYKHKRRSINPHRLQEKQLADIIHSVKSLSKKTVYAMPEHKSASCSRSSLEAAIKAAIYIILKEKYSSRFHRIEVDLFTNVVFNSWIASDFSDCLNHMRKTDHYMNYDLDLLKNALDSAHKGPNTIEKQKEIQEFNKFLRNKTSG